MATPIIRQLICEGPSCNPALRTVDAAIKGHRAKFRGEGPVEPVPDYLADELRRLVHTPHEQTRVENRFKCQTCGTERKYGASPWD